MKKIHFIDITDTQDLHINPIPPKTQNYPNRAQHQNIVRPLLSSASENLLVDKMKHLENFFTRHCRHAEGKKSQEWIKQQYDQIIASIPEPRRSLSSVRYEQHGGNYPQHSIVATFRGNSTEIVILGSHQDSIVLQGANSRAPGADDDASGTATVMEIFRILANSNFTPKRTIEFHHYACEEVGIVGSRLVAQKYKNERRQVYGYLNIDMTGYHPPGNERMGFIVEYTDTSLNNFIKLLIREYTSLQYGDIRCNYACGDHVSWQNAGYRTSFPFEVDNFSRYNPHIHSNRDLVDKFNTRRALEWVKLAIGYSIEASLA